MADKIQVVLIDTDGYVKDSCNSIFSLKDLKKSIFEVFVFLQDFVRLTDDMQPQNPPLEFDCVEMKFEDKHIFADLKISVVIHQEQSYIQLLIENKTLHYEFLREKTQKNLPPINTNVELLNLHIALKKELEWLKSSEYVRLRNEKREFLSKIARELNQPISTIIGVCSLMADAIPLSSPQFSAYLDLINGAAAYLQDIADRIFEYTESENIVLHQKDFYVQEVFDKLQHLIDTYKNFEIEITYNQNLPAVLGGDAHRFFQILLGCVSYMLKHTGKIAIQVAQIQQNTEKVVLTFGITAIPQTQKAVYTYIYSEFAYAFARRLVQFFEGKITVVDSAETPQMIVELAFSLAEQESPKTEDTHLEGKCILLLTSPQLDAEVIKQTLSKEKVNVEEIDNAEKAIQILQSQGFDLILVDEDWAKETSILKELEAKKILYLSIRNPFEYHTNFLNTITKPINPNTLLNKLKKLFAKKEDFPKEKIDLKQIYEITDGETTIVISMLEILQKNLKDYPPKMQELFSAGELKNLREMAHKFKSSTAYAGVTLFNQKLNDIELSEENGNSLKEIQEFLDYISMAAADLYQQVGDKIKELQQ